MLLPPVLFLYVPEGQGIGAIELEGQKFATGHFWTDEEFVQKYPAGQSTQSVIFEAPPPNVTVLPGHRVGICVPILQ